MTPEQQQQAAHFPMLRHFLVDEDDINNMSHLELRTAIADLAFMVDLMLDGSAEKTAGMRKLLEALDCFLRAKNEDLTKLPRGLQGPQGARPIYGEPLPRPFQ